jgi:hypothetical protein
LGESDLRGVSSPLVRGEYALAVGDAEEEPEPGEVVAECVGPEAGLPVNSARVALRIPRSDCSQPSMRR